MFQDSLSVPELAPEDVQRLQALIQTHCGLRVDATKLTYSLQRAWPALGRLGIADAPGLIRQLTFQGRTVWPALMPFLTINETYFMREPKQLEDFMAHALPGLRQRASARGQLGLKVLSAACSTGEEVYTLAMLLEDAHVRARVMGVDIDQEALTTAEGATYGAYSFRGVTPEWRAERFEEASPSTWRVKPAYRDLASFKQGNLLHVDTTLAGQHFDAIFCRNVLIYFDRPTQLAVIHQLRRLLVPGGFLFLGHSEMFFNEDLGLTMITTDRATMYQFTAGAS
jgi:chemotaxis protein methyltransferase CheR